MPNETTPAGVERTLDAMNGPWLRIDLDYEVWRLWQQPSRGGRNARTLVKHPDFRVVLTTLKAGGRIQGHRASGGISIQTVRGQLRMRVSQADTEDTIELPAGHVLALDRGVHHDVEALVDSAFLLTVAWPQGAGRVLASVVPSNAV